MSAFWEEKIWIIKEKENRILGKKEREIPEILRNQNPAQK